MTIPAIAPAAPDTGVPWPPGLVPYVTRWSAEHELPSAVVPARGGGGIAFADEQLHDRDRHGVLWVRRQVHQGGGSPLFSKVHSVRQRYAMRRLRCQACRQPADRNEQGLLWLLEDGRADRPDWPEGELTAHPPVCRGGCVEKVTEQCPHLRDNWVTVRVREPLLDGIFGRLYLPGRPLPVPATGVTRLYDAPDVRWVLASQLVATLADCTIESAWAQRPSPTTGTRPGPAPSRTGVRHARRRRSR
ncbi:hypothetical protein [Streptomyces sp. NPDC017529]|uniref:hypothetical protein n=1 Tax=Streptomyces sp. NPDC017529 TaxID=3365000 RepID=UPI0037AD79F4